MTGFVLASLLCALMPLTQATSAQEQRPSVDDLVKMKIHGVTPEFVRQTRELGFKDLSIDDLVKMRIHRVTPEYIKAIRDLGYANVTVDQLVKLRIHGVTPEFIKEVRAMGFKDDMDSDEIIELAIHGRKWLKMLKEKDTK